MSENKRKSCISPALACSAVVTVVSLLQGCSSAAHLISAATTSPGEKTCSLHLSINTSPLPSAFSEARMSGGFAGRDEEIIVQVEKVDDAADNRARWKTISGRSYWSQSSPCFAASPLRVVIESTDGLWSATFPIVELVPNPVYGDFYVSINGHLARLSLAENIGKTYYVPAAMTMRWATEPLRKIAEVDLVKARQ